MTGLAQSHSKSCAQMGWQTWYKLNFQIEFQAEQQHTPDPAIVQAWETHTAM